MGSILKIVEYATFLIKELLNIKYGEKYVIKWN